MKLFLDISDKKIDLAVQLFESLSFVNRVHPIHVASVKMWEEVLQAAETVKLHKEGKVTLRSSKDV